MPRRVSKVQRGRGIVFDVKSDKLYRDQLMDQWRAAGSPGGSFAGWLYTQPGFKTPQDQRERQDEYFTARREYLAALRGPEVDHTKAGMEARQRKIWGPSWDTFSDEQKKNAVMYSFVAGSPRFPEASKGLVLAGLHPVIRPGLDAATDLLTDALPSVLTGNLSGLIKPAARAAARVGSAIAGQDSTAGRVLTGVADMVGSGAQGCGGSLASLRRLIAASQ